MPQRQFAVRPDALAEDLHMAGAVHRLQREVLSSSSTSAMNMCCAEFLPVAGLLPERAVHQLRGLHLLVAGGVQPAAHVVLGGAVELPALRVPEDAADRFLLQVEQAHLLADAAVVAASPPPPACAGRRPVPSGRARRCRRCGCSMALR